MTKIQEKYNEWREICQDLIDDGLNCSIDCGEGSVREDFSSFAELEKEITFEEMFELEKNY
jgi:hypothetical protein